MWWFEYLILMAIDLFLCLFLSLSFILDDLVKQSTQSSAIIAIPSSCKTARRICNSLLGFFNCNGTLFRVWYFSFRLYTAFRAMYQGIDTHSLPKLAQAGITHLKCSFRWILKSSGWLQFQAILPKKSCIQWENHGYPGWCNHSCYINAWVSKRIQKRTINKLRLAVQWVILGEFSLINFLTKLLLLEVSSWFVVSYRIHYYRSTNKPKILN